MSDGEKSLSCRVVREHPLKWVESKSGKNGWLIRLIFYKQLDFDEKCIVEENSDFWGL